MITSDRRPARTRNTTIIVVLGQINTIAATPWVDFRVGEPIRTPPIRGWLGRMSERRLAPARPIVSLGPRSGSARNRRAAEPSLPETVLTKRRDSGFPAGPRYRPSSSAARSLTQGAALENPAGRWPKQRGRIARFFAEPERQIGILEHERHAIVNWRHVGAWFDCNDAAGPSDCAVCRPVAFPRPLSPVLSRCAREPDACRLHLVRPPGEYSSVGIFARRC